MTRPTLHDLPWRRLTAELVAFISLPLALSPPRAGPDVDMGLVSGCVWAGAGLAWVMLGRLFWRKA